MWFCLRRAYLLSPGRRRCAQKNADQESLPNAEANLSRRPSHLHRGERAATRSHIVVGESVVPHRHRAQGNLCACLVAHRSASADSVHARWRAGRDGAGLGCAREVRAGRLLSRRLPVYPANERIALPDRCQTGFARIVSALGAGRRPVFGYDDARPGVFAGPRRSVSRPDASACPANERTELPPL